MPTYQYRNNSTGDIEERNVPIDERDAQAGFERLIIPTRIGFQTGAIDPCSPESMVPKAFKKLEESQSARNICKQVQFSRDHIRRVWAFCLAFALLVSLPARASDVSPGYQFTPTDNVTSTKLNNAASGSINTSFISGQAAESAPDNADQFIVNSILLGGYRKLTFANLLTSNAAFIANVVSQVITNSTIITSQSVSNAVGTNTLLLVLSDTGTLAQINYSNFLSSITPQAYRVHDFGCIATNTAGSFAHNLGGVPKDYKFVWACTNAENGYVIGDEIPYNNVYIQYNIDGIDVQLGCGANSSNLFFAVPGWGGNSGVGLGNGVPGTLPRTNNGSGIIPQVAFGTNNWHLKAYYR